jgi:hypothetical protein
LGRLRIAADWAAIVVTEKAARLRDFCLLKVAMAVKTGALATALPTENATNKPFLGQNSEIVKCIFRNN